MRLIELLKFTNELSRVVQLAIGADELVPATLFTKVKEKHNPVSWQSIAEWKSFEYGKEDWGINEFLALVQYRQGDELQILTDCSYRGGEAVVYSEADHSTFEESYGDKYGEEFMQPFDYVVINSGRQVILIHHEGLIAFVDV